MLIKILHRLLSRERGQISKVYDSIREVILFVWSTITTTTTTSTTTTTTTTTSIKRRKEEEPFFSGTHALVF